MRAGGRFEVVCFEKVLNWRVQLQYIANDETARSPKLLLLCILPAVSLCLQQSQQKQQQERVSLGTLSVASIAFGTLNHFDNDVETAAGTLQQAPPGTSVDTAELYSGGNAETILGKAIQQNQAKK
jgi:hypothetical protein